MKSDIRTLLLPAGAAASKRPMVTTEPNTTQRRFNFKTPHLFLLLGLIAPLHGFAAEAPYCIGVNGGFGSGGTTFVARNFTLPTESKCTPWNGYTKAADTVIVTTSGTSCLSTDSTQLTVSVSSAEPSYFGPGQIGVDYIQLTRASATEPFSGQDTGAFAGSAEPVSCTSSLLTLPPTY